MLPPSPLLLWFGAAQQTRVVIRINVFHQTVTHQSLTEPLPFTHPFSHSSVHSSSACHMLGPALCAGDLAALNKTDKPLSCSYGAYMAGDNKQVPAHIWRMCTTCPVEALSIQSPSVGIKWHLEGSCCIGCMACCKI